MAHAEYALSIQQPWAWAILHAGKDWENRTWKTRFRGRIRIHVGKVMDDRGFALLAARGLVLPPALSLPRGGFIGEVTIVDCWPAAAVESPWAFGPWCFQLADPAAYPALVPARGRLGIWRVKEEDHVDPVASPAPGAAV